MTVVAKMNVQSTREFGDSSLIKLSCVYEHDGLNTEAWEDRRFTKASPWGEGDLNTPHALDFQPGKPFYLVFVEADTFKGYRPYPICSLAMFVRVQKCEPWPGTTALEFVKDRTAEEHCHHTKATALNLRLSIDNPAASEQFTDGARFFLCFYRADQVSLHDAAEGNRAPLR